MEDSWAQHRDPPPLPTIFLFAPADCYTSSEPLVASTRRAFLLQAAVSLLQLNVHQPRPKARRPAQLARPAADPRCAISYHYLSFHGRGLNGSVCCTVYLCVYISKSAVLYLVIYLCSVHPCKSTSITRTPWSKMSFLGPPLRAVTDSGSLLNSRHQLTAGPAL